MRLERHVAVPFSPPHQLDVSDLLRSLVMKLVQTPEDDDTAAMRTVGMVERLRPTSPEALFRQSYRRIVQTLALAGGNLPAAEDATQEAFIQACVRWNRISRYDDPTAWVRRVAINKMRNMHRSRVRGAAAALRLVQDEPAAPPPSEPPTDLLAALQSLPIKQRMAAVLYYVEDLTTAEVAAAMGITEGSVSQHLNRARTALRSHLEVTP